MNGDLDAQVSDQRWSNRLRESAKLAVRKALYRFDLDVGRDPYSSRLVRTLDAYGIDTVLDVGANVGQFASLLRTAGFAGRIVSVEPLSGAFGVLSQRVRRDGRWECVNAAVGTAEGTGKIHIAGNSFSSSLLPMTQTHIDAAPGSGTISTEEVRMIGVPELVERYGMRPEHTLLKIDTQGYEGHVLDSAGPLLERFAAAQLELSFVELYEGQPLFEELRTRLDTAGLMLWSLDAGFSDEEGRLLQCDGLFVRPRR